MRFGPRTAWLVLPAMLAVAAPARSGRAESTPPAPVRMTLEIDWSAPELPVLPENAAPPPVPTVDIELPDGQLLGALNWPRGTTGGESIAVQNRGCRLGMGRHGTARVRVEAPLTGILIVRAGGQATAFSLSRLVETPQTTGPNAPVAVRVSRLAWDGIEVELVGGPGALHPPGGVVAPGATVPVRVGFNILASEAVDGTVRLIAVLRPANEDGQTLWRYEQTHLVASNPPAGSAPVVVLNVPAPREEGSYVLDLEATWESAAGAERGSRLGRLIGRRRSNAVPPVVVDRAVSLVVVGQERPAPEPEGQATVVESIDLARVRGPRPSANGRAPGPDPGRNGWEVPTTALVEAAFRDRVRGWIPWGADTALMPPAGPDGLPWIALGVHVPHPGRLHRLTLTIADGKPQALGVALIAASDGSRRPERVLLDATLSTTSETSSDGPLTATWPVWPDTTDPVLVLVNRGGEPVRLGSMKLEEVAGELPPASLVEPDADPPRHVGLFLPRLADLDRFGPRGDPVAVARRLSSYLAHLGATTVVLPDSLAAERSRRRALGGQAGSDPIGPDTLEVLLSLLAQSRHQVLLEVDLAGPLPGLPPRESAEALERGIVRVDARGRADEPAYSALNPAVRAAVLAHCGQVIAPRREHPNLAGLVVRIGRGPTLAGAPTTGLDDDTYARFLGAMLDPQTARAVPGRDGGDPGRFAARGQYLSGPGRTPWLAWRAREVGTLYTELAQGLQAAFPQSVLAIVTPVLDDGPTGREARRADETGESPLSAWKAVGLDFEHWPRAPEGLVVLRGVRPGLEPLAQELMTNPDLDAPVARRTHRGVLIATDSGASLSEGPLVLRAVPPGDGDEPLGHALAALDAHWLILDQAALAGRESRLAAVARVLRTLPALPAPESRPLVPEKGVAARVWKRDGRVLLGLANDTPYAITVEGVLRSGPEVGVDDLGRALRLEPRPVAGGRNLVLELPPFGVSALRVAGEAQFEPMTLYQPERAEIQYRALSLRLDRMAQGEPSTGPPNSGFEAPAARGAMVAEIGGAAPPPPGWTVRGSGAAMIDPIQRHGGAASLRFTAQDAAASVLSEPFAPPTDRELEVRAWLRSDQPGTAVQVWIEGESAGKPVVRRGTVKIERQWSEKRLRVAGLPESGLERLRLRFELIEPGNLWIDDLSVRGPRGGDSDGRAQLVLVKAQQAYRAGRIADFARLANSPWARPSNPAPVADRTGRADGPAGGRRLR